MVDYSRFDNIDTESSEDETVTAPVPAGQLPPLAVVFEGHVGEEAKSRLPFSGGEVPSVACIAFVDSNTVVTGGSDSKARIWDARTGAERMFDRKDKKGAYCFNPVRSVSVARTRGIVATASMDGCLRCYDVMTGAFAGCHDAARADLACAFSPDEKLIACGSFEGNIRILKAGHIFFGEPYRLAEEWPDLDREEDSESEWSDPAVLADSKLHNAKNLGAATGEYAEAFDGTSLAWLDATTLVSTGSDARVYMMNVCNDRNDGIMPATDGRKVPGLRCQVLAPNDSLSETEFADIAVSPIEPLFAVCRVGGAQMFYRPRRTTGYFGRNEDNPSPFLPAPNNLHIVTNLAFSPDGLLLAMLVALDAGPSAISLHSVKSHQVERTIELGSALRGNLATCMAISPNGRRLAIGRRGLALSWEIETPKSTLTTFLLYRAASSSRATVSDDAPRACHLLAQLVDRGLVAAAAHAIGFIGC